MSPAPHSEILRLRSGGDCMRSAACVAPRRSLQKL